MWALVRRKPYGICAHEITHQPGARQANDETRIPCLPARTKNDQLESFEANVGSLMVLKLV